VECFSEWEYPHPSHPNRQQDAAGMCALSTPEIATVMIASKRVNSVRIANRQARMIAA
jgi:hypothetical protein